MSHTVEEATSRRLAFAGIDLETRDELRRLWPTVEPKLDGILQHFYAHVVSEPDLKALIGMRQASLESAQKAHWKRLFSGTFDAEYLSSINRIGRAHVKIGLEPRWYIAGYQHVLNALVEVVLQRHRFSLWRANKAVAALNKAVMIDLDFAISTYQEILIEREENRTRHLSQAIDRFEANVEVALSTVENAATSMKGQADQLLEVADSASREAVSASTASDETSIGVQTVAAATEELVGSIHEISRQISGATDVARRATDTAGNASSEIERLSFAAQKIGDVVGLIQAIAEQTNLLALNATIEAARAGEAGRGFAIVAQEVKDLASQTSRATEDISAQISEVQTVTGRAVDTIGATASTVGEIDALTAAIAAAVEQQGTATQEISVNIQQAASGSSTLARNVTSVNEAIARTGDTASEFLNVSDNLLAQSGTITSMVRAFISEIRDEEASNADDVDNARVVGDGAMTTSAHGRAA